MRRGFVQALLFAKPSAPGARTLLNTVSKEEHQQKVDEETVALKRRAEEAKEAAKQKRRLSAERSAVGQPGLVASAARHGGSMLDALAAAAAQARGEEDEDATEADSDSSSDAGGASGSASQTYKHSVTGHNVIKPPLGCVVSKSGKSRLWTEHERALVHAEAARVTRTGVSAAEKKKRIDLVRDGVIARNLCTSHAEYFGPGTPNKPKGILSQDVAMILKRQVEKSDTWGGHRGPAISEEIKAACMSAMAAVVKTKAAAFSATFLQPVALGIIIAKGAGDRVAAGADRGRGVFCASKDWVRGLMKGQKWRNAKPRGDSRKVPNHWKVLCWLMVLRVAFYVQFFSIPAALIVNADHTGMHFLQHKGKGWFPPDMCDTKVQGHGDMRQFTLLAATSMAGVMLPHQIVFEGSTANCLPAFRNVTWKQSSDLGSGSVQKMEKQKVVECSTAFRGRMEHDHGDCKGKVCGCYVPTPRAGGDVLGEEHDDPARYSPSQLIMENIGSACATHNHWSTYATSMAYVKDVFAPWVEKTIAAMREKDPNSCKPYGTQHVVLVVDVWWGWTDPAFRKWLKDNYDWINLAYVPGACTPVGQPMDAGIIAKIKGFVRSRFQEWVVRHVIIFLGRGGTPEEMKLPIDKQSIVTKVVAWLCRAREHVNSSDAEGEGLRKCWASTRLDKERHENSCREPRAPPSPPPSPRPRSS